MGAHTGDETVLVLGAGFTRAFVPQAPLLTDFYDSEELVKKFAQFRHARSILDREIDTEGRINLERLMTRLDGLMPYDFELNAEGELGLLLRELKEVFLRKLHKAKQGSSPHEDLLKRLARTCVENHINCVTFNYDDVFDEYLWKVHGTYSGDTGDSWHPDGGYGFYCRPSVASVSDTGFRMDRVAMKLLKLHGSVNWRTRRGSVSPFGVNDVLHHESWYEASKILGTDLLSISDHLEDDPFIVPPVLTKSSLTREPVLRLVWHFAYDELSTAKNVVFVGYSFPVTDLAARFLFTETLSHLPVESIQVVNYAESAGDEESVMDAYSTVFPGITAKQFDFRGALKWAEDFVSKAGETTE